MGLEQRLKPASQNISHQLGSLRWAAHHDIYRRHQMVAFSSTFVSNLNDVSENMTAASQDFLVMHNFVSATQLNFKFNCCHCTAGHCF